MEIKIQQKHFLKLKTTKINFLSSLSYKHCVEKIVWYLLRKILSQYLALQKSKNRFFRLLQVDFKKIKIRLKRSWKSIKTKPLETLFELIDVQKLASILLILLILQQIFFLHNSRFETHKIEVLKKANNFLPHLRLSVFAASNHDWELSQREFKSSLILLENYNESSNDDLSRIEEVRSIVYGDQNLKLQIEHWNQVLKVYPTYRDAYLKLSTLYYQLNYPVKANTFYQEAKKIDPNNENVIAIGKILEGK